MERIIMVGLLVKIGPNGAQWCDAPELKGYTLRLEHIGDDWMILRYENCRALGATFTPGTTREQMLEILEA